MSNKTITIHQGSGDDELEMTVEVTQEELDMMEEIRSEDSAAWEGRELDLLKSAKEAISKKNIPSEKRNTWKLIIGLILAAFIIVGTIIFAEHKNKSSKADSSQQDLSCSNDYPANIHKLYLDAVEKGLTIDEQTFYSKLNESAKSKRELFYNLKEKGVVADYEEFLNRIGLSIDWQKVLQDFSATKEKYPDLSDQVWYKEFPEFNNDPDLLQAAFDYDATVKSGKYSDENELRSKFPEFWPNIEKCEQSENLRAIYDKLVTLGSKGSYEQFLVFFEESDENRKSTYDKCKDNGYTGTYEDFLEYAGYNHTITHTSTSTNLRRRKLYDELTAYGCDLGDFESFSQKLNNEAQRRNFYDSISDYFNIGSWEEFSSKVVDQTLINNTFEGNQNTKDLYNVLNEKGVVNEGWSYEQVLQWLDDAENRAVLYNELLEKGAIIGSQSDFDSWLGFGNNHNISACVDFDKIRQSSIKEKSSGLKTYSSKQYGFTYQYDEKEFDLVEKIKKNSHCVMKLQSPVDDFKSTLVSVWENPAFSSSYDSDFISSCQSTDQGLGRVISSAIKTKISGLDALKSELIIYPPMGNTYFAAIYRVIHKNRMYMLNIYIPIEEYNRDKSYADKCASNFKFN